MKPQLALLVFVLMLTASVVAGIDSLLLTERCAQRDVNRALALTMERCEPDRIDTDTIRVYRSLIATVAVRDTAYLSLVMKEEDGQRATVLKANTGLTFGRLWALSDQRASGVLASLAALWLAVSLWIMRRQRARMVPGVRLGALCYDEHRRRFIADGREVRFTPMQQTLMELFLQAPDHLLTQQDICDRLWPKKPDASATLYTLIRRLRPMLEDIAGLHITCDRGRAYQLKNK